MVLAPEMLRPSELQVPNRHPATRTPPQSFDNSGMDVRRIIGIHGLVPRLLQTLEHTHILTCAYNTIPCVDVTPNRTGINRPEGI